MSRSIKKYPGHKLNTDQYFKRLVHRRNRMAWRSYMERLPNGSYYKYSVNPWDICDYKFVYHTYNDLKYYIKWAGIDKLYKAWMK
jgi:hypothetical protein